MIKINFDLLEELIKQHDITKLAIAVSGGRDSIALADIMKKHSKALGIELYCVIVNHNLRVSSAQEANLVKGYLTDMKIPCEILNWEHEEITSNIHSKARKARYKLIGEFCKTNNIKVALTAHHASDQLETLLMRIFRGTGVKGARGVRPKIKQEGVYFLRPLLDATRDELTDYCNSHNLKYVDDPSNTNTKFTRTKIRNFISHLHDYFDHDTVEQFTKHSNLFASQMQSHWRSYQEFICYTYNKYAKYHSDFHYIEVSSEILAHHSDIVIQVLLTALGKIAKTDTIDQAALGDIVSRFKKSTINTATLHGCIIVQKHFQILLFKEQLRQAIPITSQTQYMRYKINTTHTGLYIKSLGNEGWKKLKASGYNKPNLPDIRILFNQGAIFNADKQLIACPALKFNILKNNGLSIIKLKAK